MIRRYHRKEEMKKVGDRLNNVMEFLMIG